MKRTVATLGLLALTALWAWLAYQGAVGRDRDYRELLRNGDTALGEEQTFTAIEAYSNAIYLHPDSMLAHLRRGETYQRRGDLEAAARDFQHAAELDPSATRPLEALGDVRYKQERFRRAAETYERLLGLDDRSASVTRKLALARYRDGNLDGAMTALERAGVLGERLPDDYYLLGICLREKGLLREAAAAFEQAVLRSPALIPPREELADLYAILDRRADEIEQLQVLAGLDSQHAERQVALGLAQARVGRVETAVETLRHVLERAPDRTQIYAAIGQIWLDSSHTDPGALRKAIEALERAAPAAGATSDVMVLYGRALMLDGQFESAERVLQQATQRFPVDPSAFAEYSAVAERRGHVAEARVALIQYGALVSSEQELSGRARRIGLLSLKLNDPKDAVYWLRNAHAALPDDIGVLAALAEALLRSGDQAAGRAMALLGLEKDPTDVALRNIELRTRE